MTTSRGGGVHTLPNPNGKGWINDVRGVKSVGAPFRLKQEAEDAGRALAIRLDTDHTVHKRNGRVGSRTSYGTVQYPPPDAE